MSISNKDNSLNGARNLGRLSGNRRINGFVGQRDKIDFAKFTLAEDSDFELSLGRVTGRASARVTLRNSRGAVLQRLTSGSSGKTFRGRLSQGTYYVDVQRLRGEVNYKLTALATRAEPENPTPAPNGLNPALDIGTLSGTYTNQGFVGTTDSIDLYKFTINDVANLQARVESSAAATRIELIRDANSNGLIDNDEVLASGNDFSAPFLSSLTEDLPLGTYFIKVTPSSSSASTGYQINLVATPFGGNISPEPGNTLPLARDLGALSGTVSAREYVGKIDSIDYYRFTLNDIANIQASAQATSTNTEIQLIQDKNSNGLVDNDEILGADTNFNSTFLSSITQDLPQGSYFIGVKTRSTSASTLYTLNLVVTPFGGNLSPDPGNTIPLARDLGVLSGTFSGREHVGLLDREDFYKFTLNSTATLQARVASVTANTQIDLIRDINGNGLIDNGETIVSDTDFSSSPFLSEISRSLAAGTYLLRVIPRSASGSTNYSIDLTATPS